MSLVFLRRPSDGVAALRLREGEAGGGAATDDAASAAQTEASIAQPTARPYSEYRPEADVQKQLDASAAGLLARPHLRSARGRLAQLLSVCIMWAKVHIMVLLWSAARDHPFCSSGVSRKRSALRPSRRQWPQMNACGNSA